MRVSCANDAKLDITGRHTPTGELPDQRPFLSQALIAKSAESALIMLTG